MIVTVALAPLTLLLFGQFSLVGLLANLAAVFVAVALVGPAMFHRKLLLAGHPNEATELTHIEHAFQSVGFTAMIIGAWRPPGGTPPPRRCSVPTATPSGPGCPARTAPSSR